MCIRDRSRCHCKSFELILLIGTRPFIRSTIRNALSTNTMLSTVSHLYGHKWNPMASKVFANFVLFPKLRITVYSSNRTLIGFNLCQKAFRQPPTRWIFFGAIRRYLTLFIFGVVKRYLACSTVDAISNLLTLLGRNCNSVPTTKGSIMCHITKPEK